MDITLYIYYKLRDISAWLEQMVILIKWIGRMPMPLAIDITRLSYGACLVQWRNAFICSFVVFHVFWKYNINFLWVRYQKAHISECTGVRDGVLSLGSSLHAASIIWQFVAPFPASSGNTHWLGAKLYWLPAFRIWWIYWLSSPPPTILPYSNSLGIYC